MVDSRPFDCHMWPSFIPFCPPSKPVPTWASSLQAVKRLPKCKVCCLSWVVSTGCGWLEIELQKKMMPSSRGAQLHLLVVQKPSRCSYGDVQMGGSGIPEQCTGESWDHPACSLRAEIPENYFQRTKIQLNIGPGAQKYINLQQLTCTLKALSCLWMPLDVENLWLDHLTGWICIAILAPTLGHCVAQANPSVSTVPQAVDT